jgi:hypothetical protein
VRGLGSIYVFLVSHPRSGCETEKRKGRGRRVSDLGAAGAQVRAAWKTFELAPKAPTQKLRFQPIMQLQFEQSEC